MKTSTQKRIAGLSGLLLLSLLVVALAVPAAQAMRNFSGTSVPSTSAGSGTINTLQLPTLAKVRQHHGDVASTSVAAVQRPIGWAWGYYYSDAGASRLLAIGAQPGYYPVAVSGTSNVAQLPTLAQLPRGSDRLYGPSVASGGGTVTAAQSASSGISSTTVWIAAVAVAGVLLIGAWALLRRRRQRKALPICEVYPAGC
jgi:hypothetical protein